MRLSRPYGRRQQQRQAAGDVALKAASGTVSVERMDELQASRSIRSAAQHSLDRGSEKQEEQRVVIDTRERDTNDKGEQERRGRGQRRPGGRVPGRDALAAQHGPGFRS